MRSKRGSEKIYLINLPLSISSIPLPLPSLFFSLSLFLCICIVKYFYMRSDNSFLSLKYIYCNELNKKITLNYKNEFLLGFVLLFGTAYILRDFRPSCRISASSFFNEIIRFHGLRCSWLESTKTVNV